MSEGELEIAARTVNTQAERGPVRLQRQLQRQSITLSARSKTDPGLVGPVEMIPHVSFHRHRTYGRMKPRRYVPRAAVSSCSK
jgi:hypothetical protein